MTVAAIVLAVLAGLLSAAGGHGSGGRLARLVRPPAYTAPAQDPRRRWIAAIGVGIALGIAVGGITGVTVVPATVGLAWILGRRRTTQLERLRAASIRRDVPFAAELLAATLRAGSPIALGAQAVAAALGGPLGDRLAMVGAELRLGAEPAAAWAALAAEPGLGGLVRTVARSADSGAPLADQLLRLAADARHELRAAALAAARRAGVMAVAPLGLCFLPAFVLIGIVPVVAGLATQVLAG